MKTRTSTRPALCWSMVNGSTCLCYECWSCKRKMKYLTKEIAKTKAYRARKRTNTLITEYHCRFCGLFHIGHVGRKY